MHGIAATWFANRTVNAGGIYSMYNGLVPPNIEKCWANAADEESCCLAAERGLRQLQHACFDSIFTFAECCDGVFDGRGYALVSPHILPEPPRAAGLASHPALGSGQARFESDHLPASSLFEVKWVTFDSRPVSMILHFFKRSAGVVDNLYTSIFEYLAAIRPGYLAAGDVILDVGASIGSFAIAMALEFPQVRVYAIEPAPQNYRYLLWNIRLNNLTRRVWPLNVALRGPRDAPTASLQYSPVWPISSAYCIPGAHCDFVAYSAPALTFTGLLRMLRIQQIQWLKLDCEGCEWSITADPALLPLLRRVVHLLTVELHPREASQGDAAKQLVELVCPDAAAQEKVLEVLSFQGKSPPWLAQICNSRPKTFNEARVAEYCTLFINQSIESCSDEAGKAKALTTGNNLGSRWALEALQVVSSSASPRRALPRTMGPLASLSVSDTIAAPNFRSEEQAWKEPRAERRIFLLTSWSHDDWDQWPLIPHFIVHYRDHLGLEPATFLWILHSDSRNTTGIAHMAKWLKDDFGIRHTFHVIEPYTALLHMLTKIEILHHYVSDEDWIMQVDADEFVVFPHGERAHQALHRLDTNRQNVHYALLVDRVAANGDVDVGPTNTTALFDQYPLNCAITLLVQQSDVRKASAYRGYLRVTSGNHEVIGLNQTAERLTARHPRATVRLKRTILNFLGDRIFRMLPQHYLKEQALPVIYAAPLFATAYHFKWIKGVAQKLRRRAVTEVSTVGQYAGVRTMLDKDHRFQPGHIAGLCNTLELPGPQEPVRGLTAREMIMLFLNSRSEHVEAILDQQGVSKPQREKYIADLLRRTITDGIARTSAIPVH